MAFLFVVFLLALTGFCLGSAAAAGGWVAFWTALLALALVTYFVILEGREQDRRRS